MAGTLGRAAESRAKEAIYGGYGDEGRPITPNRHGKKMVAGSSGAGGVPFATFDGALESERYPTDFHLLEKGKCTYEKVGTHEFDSNVYRQQAEFRHAVDVESRARNSGGPTPFAADYSAPGGTAYPKDFVLLAKREREPTGKVGNMEAWDNEVYTSQRATNAAIHEQTRIKKFGQPGMDASHGAPFATSDAFDDLRRRDYYHAKPKKDRTGAGKPYSQAEFDPAPYGQQLRQNVANQQTSTQRNFVGSGNILAPGSS